MPHAIGTQVLRRRHGSALTREPGDLPDAVVFRPARVRRTDGENPRDDIVDLCPRGTGPEVMKGYP